MKLLGGLLNVLLGRRGGKPSKAASSSESLLLSVVFVLLGVLIVFTFLYWATGQVAGRVFGGSWPEVSFAAMPGILVALLGSLGDPAAAWPKPDRALLPGPVGFYGIMVALCLLPASAGVGGLYLYLREDRARKAAAMPANRRPRRRRAFARRRALRPLVVSKPQPGRVTLGRAAGGKLLAAEVGQSVVVLGPAGSMKTAGLVLPALLEWRGPAVVTSSSLRLILDSLERRQKLGSVCVYDPAAYLTGADVMRVHWDPLRHAATWKAALPTARSLCTAASEPVAEPAPAGPASEADVSPAAAGLLAAALLAAARGRRSVTEALRWLESGELGEIERALSAAGNRLALGELEAFGRQEETRRERTFAHAARVLAPWADAEARQATQQDPAGGEPLDFNLLLDGGTHTLYLTAPADDLQRFRPMLATVLQEAVAAARERAQRDGLTIDLTTSAPGAFGPGGELLMVLDDAADIGALRTLDLHATGACRGVQFLSTLRGLADVRARYGERAHAVLNAHRARVVLSGTGDAETLDYLANVLGDATFRADRQTAERRLTPAGVLREPQPGAGLLLYGSLPPVELSLRPWFRERRVRALIGPRRLAAYGRSR